VTDKLASYGVAHRQLMGSVAHRQSRYLNNRAENSHQPTRQRERAMKRFKSVRHAQRFLSAFSGISAHFRPRRHMGFPRNRGGFLYAASGWMAAIFSYSTGGSNPAELWRRRVL